MKFIQLAITIVIILIVSSCMPVREEKEMSEKTQLQETIERWTQNGGNITEMLRGVYYEPIKKKNDAVAISQALKSISFLREEKKFQIGNPLSTLTAFFQQVESQEAFDAFKKNGIPELRRIFDEAFNQPGNHKSDLMFVLKILAMYRQKEDAYKVVEIAKSGFQSDGYMWTVILGIFDKGHPHWQIVMDGLREPLPQGFLCIAYLDFANDHAIQGNLQQHPFNTDAGFARLEKWLLDKNHEKFSYARSSMTALPFLDSKYRARLLLAGRKHPDDDVKIESAWAAAKTGDTTGIQDLKKWAVDVNYSIVACQYLKELGHENKIPKKALDEDFKAMAEMSNWLSHPCEFGKPPDQIIQYDSRILYWPPTGDKRKVWLFKYTYEPTEEGEERDIGISMVGSVTFAIFGESTENLTPEEVYGLHCAWELERNNDPRVPKKISPKAGLEILRQYNKDF